MTVSASSTASPIDRPRPLPERRPARDPDTGQTTRPSTAAIVTSLHARTGKTLLARVLGDYFALSGRPPLIFDTDVTEQALRASFPYDTVVVDLVETRDQMTLFDTMARCAPEARVVDVSHHMLRKFLKLMHESQFAAEARVRGIEPIIFYITDRNPDAFEEALALRKRFDDCALVLVDNAFIGRVKEQTRRSAAYQEMQEHGLRMTLPRLDPALADALDDPALSLSEIVSQPLSRSESEPCGPGDLPFEDRALLRSWLMHVFRDVHRLIRAAENGAPPLIPADPAG